MKFSSIVHEFGCQLDEASQEVQKVRGHHCGHCDPNLNLNGNGGWDGRIDRHP
jgi:hypothetical protein